MQVIALHLLPQPPDIEINAATLFNFWNNAKKACYRYWAIELK